MSGFHSGKIARWASLLLMSLALPPAPAAAQFSWSGDFATTGSTLDRHLLENTNNRNDDPFHPARLRLFARRWINDRTGIFTEFLWDSNASFRINGAYFVVNNLLGQSWLSLKGGLIPSPFGNYSLRSTYFNLNPLIGIPLFWHYKTPLPTSEFPSNSLLFGDQTARRAPIGYDACWDTGWELFGEFAFIDYSLALTEATLSSPSAKSNDGRQIIARLGLNFFPSIRAGGSIATGPYLSSGAAEDLPDPYPAVQASYHGGTADSTTLLKIEDYSSTIMGLYAQYQKGYLQLFSEVMTATYESPFIDPDGELTMTSGYLEGRLDLMAGYFAAARYDFLNYGEITNPATSKLESWGADLVRIEAGIGYRITRETMVKMVYQMNNYAPAERDDPAILALQYHLVF